MSAKAAPLQALGNRPLHQRATRSIEGRGEPQTVNCIPYTPDSPIRLISDSFCLARSKLRPNVTLTMDGLLPAGRQ